MLLQELIRNVQDFPKPGIGFKDITTLVGDAEGLHDSVIQMLAPFDETKIDAVLGIESRGFIFAAAMAFHLNVGMVPVRKPGKLPYETISEKYELEYGQDSLEIHTDAVKSGDRMLIVDDLLATGGTVEATIRLVERLGGKVLGCSFLVELDFLKGREKLSGYQVESIIHYQSE
ncbi:MAG: adenine phosphoribosyltransferase [candidate division KSB1 bacterium]|nr:adenine phosphoribosyltransferase [candidate division KSB1 bacterium]